MDPTGKSQNLDKSLAIKSYDSAAVGADVNGPLVIFDKRDAEIFLVPAFFLGEDTASAPGADKRPRGPVPIHNRS